MPKQHEIETVRLAIRPPRIVIFVRESADWISSYRSCITWCSSVWGGHRALIIPYGTAKASPWFDLLLRSFDPDFVLVLGDEKKPPITLPKRVAPFALADDFLRIMTPEFVVGPEWPLSHADELVRAYPTRFASNPVLPALPPLLEAVVLSRLGRMVDSSRTRHVQEELTPDEAVAVAVSIGNPPLSKRMGAWPFRMTALGTDIYQGENAFGGISREDPLLVLGSEFVDLCLFHALSRMRGNVALAVPEVLASQEFVDRLTDRSIGTAVHVTSASLVGPAQLADAFDGTLAQHLTPLWHRPASIPDPYRDFVETPFAGGHSEHFLNGQAAGLVPVPQPEFATDGRRPYWIVSAKFGDVVEAIPESSALVCDREPHESRCSTEGVSFISPDPHWHREPLAAAIPRIRLSLPSKHAVLAAFFAQFGLTATLSDKGRYVTGAIEIFGGILQLSAALLSADAVAYRTLCLPDDVDETLQQSGVIHLKGRGRFAHRSFFRQRALDVDLVRRVLNPGRIMRCAMCRFTDWYPLERVNRSFQCSRCLGEQVVTSRNGIGPYGADETFYRLHGVLQEGLRNDLEMVAHVLARASLDRGSVFPNFELENPGGKMEVDGASICRGDMEMFECKRGAELGRSETDERSNIRKLLRLGAQIGARVVFVTSELDWRNETRLRVRQESEEAGAVYEFWRWETGMSIHRLSP